MDYGIKGERALILASSRGLGFGCAKVLAGEGVRCVINGLDAERGRKAAEALGPGHLFVQGSVAKPEDRQRIYETAVAHLGDVSILVNNAYGPKAGRFLDKTNADWWEAYEENMLSALDFTYRCLPKMLERGWGRIVNVNSMSAKEPSANTPLGNGIKPALLGAFGTLAREVADKGVTVNNMLPGPFDTDLLRRYAKFMIRREDLDDDTATETFARQIPARRLGTIEEFGALCAFLASRQAGFITAQSITIDGAVIKSLL